MFGLVAYDPSPPVRIIDGVCFRAVRVAEGRSLRARLSACGAAETLRRERVRFALFPPDYPFLTSFARRGVLPPPPAPFYRAAAPAIVRRRMEHLCIDPHRSTVAFSAQELTPELRRCVLALCGEIRYIALSIPCGGEAFARELRRMYGIAARLGAVDSPPRPDLVVVFDGSGAPEDALRLDGTLDVVFDDPRPRDLLALLWRAGTLDAAALGVSAVVPAADR